MVDGRADDVLHTDQDPVPLSEQTWAGKDFVGYWVSDLVNVTSWQIASTPLVLGLSTVDAIMIVFVSGIVNGIAMGMHVQLALSANG